MIIWIWDIEEFGKGLECQLLLWASLVAQSAKNLPAMQENWVRFLGWEGPLQGQQAAGGAGHASGVQPAQVRLTHAHPALPTGEAGGRSGPWSVGSDRRTRRGARTLAGVSRGRGSAGRAADFRIHACVE